MLRAASIFGSPIPAAGQNVPVAIYRVLDRDQQPRGADFWHSDNSYNPAPGGPTALYGLTIPTSADGVPLGDTFFADAAAAAAELPVKLRERLTALSAAHNMAHNGGVLLPEYKCGEWERGPDAVHPVLRTNPLSAREVLFVSPAYVCSIVGMPVKESELLLADLYEHMLQERYIYRHQWHAGDFIVWDNGRLLHRATTLEMPPGAERVMLRVQTRGPGILDPVAP